MENLKVTYYNLSELIPDPDNLSLFETKEDGSIEMRETKIEWISEDLGFLDEGKDYTIFSIRFEAEVFKLYRTGNGWKKTSKPKVCSSLWQARRLAEATARAIKK